MSLRDSFPKATYPIALNQLHHLSKSSLEIFEQCPRTWASQYLFGRRDREGNKYSRIGTASHAIVEAHLKMEQLPMDQLNHIPAHEQSNTINYALSRDRGRGTIGVEHEFLFKFREDAPPLYGLIDHLFWHPVELAVVIEDHKTNRQYDNSDYWRETLQCQIYSMVTRYLTGVDTVYFRIGYVNQPNLPPPLVRTTKESDLQLLVRLNELWDKMITYAGSVDRVPRLEDFPETITDSCKYCLLRSSCTSFRNNVIYFDAATIQQSLIPPIERLEKLTTIKKLLEHYIEETKVDARTQLESGPVIYEGREYYLGKESGNRVVTPTELFNVIKEYGEEHDPNIWEDLSRKTNSVFKVSVTELDE